jgi:DNA-binding transcriptional MerR regulator
MKIGRAAEIAGISVRTLRHYDQIGLLHPDVGAAGYRSYGDGEMETLWRILFFRELGFPLGQIKKMLHEPAAAQKEALRGQRGLLTEKKEHLEKILTDIDRILEKGFEVNMVKTFDVSALEEHKKQYAKEAAERYGETYRQAQERTAHYGQEDWQRVMEESQNIFDSLAGCMQRGPDAPETLYWVGKWQEYITRRFYSCTPEILRGLGELYVSDGRFTRNIDKTHPGLAAFLKQAIDAYCDKPHSP